jgi:uncharacterized protein
VTRLSKEMAPPRAWQRMLSGRRLDLLDPSPFDIEIEDIAHGLSRVARWNGQTKGDYVFSVAQHSLLVEQISRTLSPGLGAKEQLSILLHDAAEYVIGDMISPFKNALGMDYRQFEERLQNAIHLHFGLPQKTTQSLARVTKSADKGAAYYEATLLAGFSEDEARDFFGPPPSLTREARLLIDPLPAESVKSALIERVKSLMADFAAL